MAADDQMRCPTCGAVVQARQRFCMDCGSSLAGTGTGTGTGTSTAATAVLGAAPPTSPVPLNSPATDPTMQIRIVEQTSSSPMVDWSTTGSVAPAAQVWPPAPALAPQPVTAAAAPFIDDAWHTEVDDGWRSGAPPAGDPEPFDAAALTIFAVLALVLALVAMFTNLISFDFGEGTTGSFKIDAVSSNAIPSTIVVAIVLVLGCGAAIARRRIGAGLAAGAGLALAGLVAIDLAVVQERIEALKLFVSEGQALSITREVPYFVMIGAGACGLVVFLVSFPAARGDGRPRLNAAICSVGALAALVLAAGPFVPGHGSTWGSNTDAAVFSSFVPWLRIGAMALVAVAGVAGFSNQRRWGVGVALGGLTAVVVQWIGTLSSNPPAGRTGVGILSIGTTDGRPNLLIGIGLAVTVLAGLTAVLIDMAARRAR